MAVDAAPEKLTLRDAEGMVTEEATMKNGVLDGETLLYSAGKLSARLQFREGKQNGEALFYDDAGRVSTKAHYLNDKLHGESQYFNPAGVLVRKASYREGLLHGHTIDYYPTGKPREVSTYQANVLHGELIRLGVDGKIVERLYYNRGRPRATPPPRKSTQASGNAVEGRG
jgi:antitoxin component YwqK of YwqJK toxin-antitoxin module